jgi:glycosyltransferase involved in cell wall biosynthesis
LSDNPRVCVLVPSYRTAQYIAETLDSVFSQTYTNTEVVVVNDCSPDTDELEQVLLPWRNRIRYIKHDENRGLAAARNTAIRATGAELIALLDSDDLWVPSALQVQVDYLKSHPDVDAVYGDAVYFGKANGGRKFSDLFPSSGQVTLESVLARRCNVLVSVLAKREAVVNVGMFDDSLRRCEDFELWCRLLYGGYKIGYHRNVILRYRQSAQSLSASPIAMLHAIIGVYENIRATWKLTGAETVALDEQLRRCRAEAFFHEARISFLSRDFETASEKLRLATSLAPGFRMNLIALMVRTCPSFLYWVYGYKQVLNTRSLA